MRGSDDGAKFAYKYVLVCGSGYVGMLDMVRYVLVLLWFCCVLCVFSLWRSFDLLICDILSVTLMIFFCLVCLFVFVSCFIVVVFFVCFGGV